MNSTISALAEPNRLQIVELLRDGPLTVGEIADRLELNQPQASKHLRVLSDAGIEARLRFIFEPLTTKVTRFLGSPF